MSDTAETHAESRKRTQEVINKGNELVREARELLARTAEIAKEAGLNNPLIKQFFESDKVSQAVRNQSRAEIDHFLNELEEAKRQAQREARQQSSEPQAHKKPKMNRMV
jgi:AcrR family transcriptional regulator